ncbi:MAG TPA: lipoprotein [Burkholderiaceae bacterium]|nr:lipoprotein [Burkholderiaceae bacterium]HMY98755.1 lipoprotein [Burkholderiaceae bacterium]HNB43432.1 lipoprotein [Burkholderiaceae bacterium]
MTNDLRPSVASAQSPGGGAASPTASGNGSHSPGRAALRPAPRGLAAWVATLGCAALLAACGQKGPLYLPKAKPVNGAASAASNAPAASRP